MEHEADEQVRDPTWDVLDGSATMAAYPWFQE
jgi:hypothetical protein